MASFVSLQCACGGELQPETIVGRWRCNMCQHLYLLVANNDSCMVDFLSDNTEPFMTPEDFAAWEFASDEALNRFEEQLDDD